VSKRGASPTVREGSDPNRAVRDFDNNEFPLAYLITFRCYGTWLHGDERGSYRRSPGVIPGVLRIPPRPRLKQAEVKQLAHRPVRLNKNQRATVERAVREVCLHRKYGLRVINVRSNHAHAVVSALSDPEPILDAFKSYSTRALRETALLGKNIRPWARHGSTIYLWKERDVEKAVEYVLLGQDREFSLD
jgi:REP element-mobilizing transposase RayT